MIILASLGFPIWLRITHYINLLFIGLLMRSGIQIIAVIALIIVAAIYAWASVYTTRHPRQMQHALGVIVDPVRHALLHREVSKQHYSHSDSQLRASLKVFYLTKDK
jgi:hypothetical protein